MSKAATEPEPEPPSPVLPFVVGAAVAAAVSAVVCRLFTTGGGTELFQPGAQLLFDALALCAVAFTIMARLLRGERPLQSSGRVLLPLAVLVAVLAFGASRAPTSDLGWRTACTATSLLLLALTLRDLARLDRRVGTACLAALIGCVVGGAVLALHHYLVELPELLAQYERGAFASELKGLDRSMAIAFDERIKSRQAVGPFLLPGLAATILAAALPLLALLTWDARQRRPLAVPLSALLLVVATALVLTKSKGVIVTLTGTAGVFVLLHPGLQRYRRRLFLGAGAGALLLTLVGIGALVAGPERIGIGLSLTVRMEYWEAGVAMWKEHPLLGVGLNGFRDWFPLMKSLRAEETAYAHNAVVQLLADLGLVGLVSALTVAVVWVWGPVAATARDEPTEGDAVGEEVLSERALWVALGAGLLLGLPLLGGFGDAYDASRPGLLALGVFVAAGAVVPLRWALRDFSGDRRLLRAALLAGAAALLFDGTLNFGLNHPGVFVLTTSLAALAPALGGGRLDPPRPVWAHRLVAVPVLVLAPALLLLVVPDAVEGDRARRRGIARMQAATQGDPTVPLLEATEAFSASVEAYPYHARTWLNLAGALRSLASLPGKGELAEPAEAAAREAIQRAPRAAEARRELADLLRPRDPEAALTALDEAVALYPGHPELLLETGRLRVELLRSGKDGGDAKRRRERARANLKAALHASETTRLVRRRLSEEQRKALARLLDTLGTD